MRTNEALSVLLFLGMVGAVYVAAAGVCVRTIYRRFRPRGADSPLPRWRRWAYRVVGSVAMLGILCGLYAAFVERPCEPT